MGLIAKLRTSDICWIAEKSLTALVKSKSPMPTNVQKPTKAKCWRSPDRSNRCSRKKSKPLGSRDFCFFFLVTGVKSLSRPQHWAHRTRAIVRQMKKPWRGTEGNEDIRHVKTCHVKNMNLWKLKFDTALLSNSHQYNPSLRPQIFWLLAFGLVDPRYYPPVVARRSLSFRDHCIGWRWALLTVVIFRKGVTFPGLALEMS